MNASPGPTMIYLLVLRRPCQDSYYPSYNDVVWVGAEPPGEEVIEALWEPHDHDHYTRLLLYSGPAGEVTLDGDIEDDEPAENYRVVRPRPPIIYEVRVDGEPIYTSVQATTEADALGKLDGYGNGGKVTVHPICDNPECWQGFPNSTVPNMLMDHWGGDEPASCSNRCYRALRASGAA